MDPNAIGIGAVTAVFVAVIAATNLGNYRRFIDYVEADLADRLHSLRASPEHLRRWIEVWLGIVVAVFFVMGLGVNFPLATVVASLLSAGPWYVIRRASQKRRQRIEDQLADAMVMFSSAVRAGLSLPQALELLATDCPAPINQEFSQLVGEYKLGKPLERTLEEAKDRLKSENFVLFAAALLASRESGGKLNETVERISKSVLEVQRLERKVRSETAQARKSSIYMVAVMPVILVAYWWLEPSAVERLFTSFAGAMVLSVAIVLNLIAYLWARKILAADI